MKTTVSGICSVKGTSADDAATDEKKSVTIDSQSCVGLGRRQARGMAALSAAALQKVVAALRANLRTRLRKPQSELAS